MNPMENIKAKMSILQKLNYHTTKLQLLIKTLHFKLIIPELDNMDIDELKKADLKIDEVCRMIEYMTMENILEGEIEDDFEDETDAQAGLSEQA